MTARTAARRSRCVSTLWLILWLLACGGPEAWREESVEMITGSYRTVADGRAEITIGEFGDRWSEELRIMIEAVEVEVSCGEEAATVWVSEDTLTEPVCRVQLELEEIVSWSPPKARFKIVWEDE